MNAVSSDSDSSDGQPQLKPLSSDSDSSSSSYTTSPSLQVTKTTTKRKISPSKRPKPKKARSYESEEEDGPSKLGSVVVTDLEERKRLKDMTEAERENALYSKYVADENQRELKKVLGGEGKCGVVDDNFTANSSDDDHPKPVKALSLDREVTPDLDFHMPSDIQGKREKRDAMKHYVQKRKTKKEAEERKQKPVLDVNECFGKGDEEESSSNSGSSRSPTPTTTRPKKAKSPPKEAVLKAVPITTIEELVKIRLSRHKLALHCHAKFFPELIVGCFVRIGANFKDGQQIYRIAEILEVKEGTKVYEFEKARTNLMLKIRYGETVRPYRMEYVSNTMFTKDEFDVWKGNLQKAGLSMPTNKRIAEKEKDIWSMLNHEYTESDANYIVEQKNKFRTGPMNFAARKGFLLREKAAAALANNKKRIGEIDGELELIEEKASAAEKKVTKTQDIMNKINLRNKQTMQDIFLSNNAPIDIPSQDDPFTRKSNRMRVVAGRSKEQMALAEANKKLEQEKEALPVEDTKPPLVTQMTKAEMFESIDIDLDDL